MPSLGALLKFGYALVVVSLLLMVWASLVGARDNPSVSYPPCYFNQLCTCSKAVPDLGIVQCYDVPLPRLPPPLNTSKVFMLYLENNGLRSLEPHFLQSSGLYRLAVKHNPLYEIPDEALYGLENSLWELRLQNVHLRSIPNRAFRHLVKLKNLDLSGNEITEVFSESWRGLESSLQTLILSGNAISVLPSDAFALLTSLELLDLRGNAIMELDVDTFRSGPTRLAHLYLEDNQLSSIPYQQLSKLKLLRTLDLSANRISSLHSAISEPETPMALDVLRLSYNQIQYLPPGAFQHFELINKTYLDGNPLTVIQADAFRDARIRELSLNLCGISELSAGAFSGLEPSLQLLDLGGNNITHLPDAILTEYDFLRTLIIRDNNIADIYPRLPHDVPHNLSPQTAINGYQFSLYRVDLGGKTMGTTSLQDLRRMRNLRSLSISRLPKNHLSAEDFQEFGVDLEELRISESNLQSIKGHAFSHARGLKRLDLSDNSIASIEGDAFTEIGHSLVSLSLSHGLASSVSSVFGEAFRPLTAIQYLDLSNNRLRSMPDNSFHFMKRLKELHLEDNQIEQVHKGTFQGKIHTELEEIDLAFNNLDRISTETFVELQIQRLSLDDNRITRIDRHAFMSMDRLKELSLRGNKIQTIAHEAFLNLPDLEHLNLAYNSLAMFDFEAFDQFGVVSGVKLNVSHNELNSLALNATANLNVNIKVLDMSYNNITKISRDYLKPLHRSLTHLFLQRNIIVNATREVFGNLPYLQWLDMSYNRLDDLDFDAFRNTKSLQILDLSHNFLVDIPAELLRGLTALRVIDFSNNRFRILPDNLFNEGGLERLDLSHNFLTRFPAPSLSSAAAATLCELSLSHNAISSLLAPDALMRFRSLSHVDLSHNRLVRLEDAMFSHLPHLTSLDLGHNTELLLDSRGRTFSGLSDSLLELNLENTSLSLVPDLPLPLLRDLNLADNEITVAPFEMAVNLTSLHLLDMRGNKLEQVPPLARSLPQLTHLFLGRNPIPNLSNSSFMPVAEKLRELDLQHLPLTYFENGALSKMRSLKVLHISPYPDIYDFNLPRILQHATGLKDLHIEVYDKEELTEGMMLGDMPNKIENMTITGQAMHYLPYNVLRGIRSPRLHLGIRNTTLDTIPRTIFEQARRVRNLTLDLRNNTFRSLSNPNTGDRPGLPRAVFLQDLQVSGNRWACDCELGWVEVWSRKQRQYLCREGCDLHHDDLRMATCANRNNASMLQVFKTEIECGWGSGADHHNIPWPIVILATLASIFIAF